MGEKAAGVRSSTVDAGPAQVANFDVRTGPKHQTRQRSKSHTDNSICKGTRWPGLYQLRHCTKGNSSCSEPPLRRTDLRTGVSQRKPTRSRENSPRGQMRSLLQPCHVTLKKKTRGGENPAPRGQNPESTPPCRRNGPRSPQRRVDPIARTATVLATKHV